MIHPDYNCPEPLLDENGVYVWRYADEIAHLNFAAHLNGNDEVLIDIRDELQLDETPSGAYYSGDFKEIWLHFGSGAIYTWAIYERYR